MNRRITIGIFLLISYQLTSQLNISFPNSYYSFNPGEQIEIKWTSSGNISLVSIELEDDLGHIEEVIVDPTNNSGRYSWIIPTNINPGFYRIKIYESGTGYGVDYSDIYFQIGGSIIYTVNSEGDLKDNAKGNRICGDINGNCSLRAAIEESNANASSTIILFSNNIHEIHLDDNLPEVLYPMTIDGGSTGQVIINGINTRDGLEVNSSDFNIYGVHFTNFSGDAFWINGDINNFEIGRAYKGCIFTNNNFAVFITGIVNNLLIQGNYFGTDSTFSSELGNDHDLKFNGNSSQSLSNATVGGDFRSPESNFFCNSKNVGLSFTNNTNNIEIIGNYFGTDSSATKNLGCNASILLHEGIIGGSVPTRNIIHNSGFIGIISGSSPNPGNITVTFNDFYNNSVVANSYGDNTFLNNTWRCNQRLLLGGHLNEPEITNANFNEINGAAMDARIVYLYLSDTTCPNNPCQPGTFIDSALVDSQGHWTINGAFSNISGQRLVALSADINNLTSHVSDCYFVLPDDCELSTVLPVNLDPLHYRRGCIGHDSTNRFF